MIYYEVHGITEAGRDALYDKSQPMAFGTVAWGRDVRTARLRKP